MKNTFLPVLLFSLFLFISESIFAEGNVCHGTIQTGRTN